MTSTTKIMMHTLPNDILFFIVECLTVTESTKLSSTSRRLMAEIQQFYTSLVSLKFGYLTKDKGFVYHHIPTPIKMRSDTKLEEIKKIGAFPIIKRIDWLKRYPTMTEQDKRELDGAISWYKNKKSSYTIWLEEQHHPSYPTEQTTLNELKQCAGSRTVEGYPVLVITPQVSKKCIIM